MQKSIKTILLFFLLTPLWGAGGLQAQNTETTDEGVIINGIKWATRNVDMPGTFAETPESAGMFYQWNRKKAWNVTDSIITGWDETEPIGDMWEKENDPCPIGWRVPTEKEQQRLVDTAKVTNKWITQNGTIGLKFTDETAKDSLFLPAKGFRSYYGHSGISGKLISADVCAYYWSSVPLNGY
ncbi:MAG: fibrobacter succinogenes major paralogous domain-containing protein, partial [Bacteroidetes bacterium]|nr:fibrobacter succinogenes major paralogous domain-containing protein [Bacteroidota bacterium]